MSGQAPADQGPDPDLEVVPMLAREQQSNIVAPTHRQGVPDASSSEEEEEEEAESDSDSSSEDEGVSTRTARRRCVPCCRLVRLSVPCVLCPVSRRFPGYVR